MANTEGMSIKSLFPFLVITFALTWGIAALIILFTDQIVEVFGEISARNPLFILAVYSPGITGIFLVWRNYGIKGLGQFFKRLTLWRMPWVWWAFIIFGIPLLAYFGAVLKGSISETITYSPWYLVLPVLVYAFFLGPFEEFGWRGVALPLLQRKMAPFWAGLLLGVIWAGWHIPAFLLSGTSFDSWAPIPFFGGVIALSIIITPIFNSSKGSLLIAYLWHFQMMNPLFPDSQPWDSLVFALVALIIVLLNRKTMFKKGTGVTSVLIDKTTE